MTCSLSPTRARSLALAEQTGALFRSLKKVQVRSESSEPFQDPDGGDRISYRFAVSGNRFRLTFEKTSTSTEQNDVELQKMPFVYENIHLQGV